MGRPALKPDLAKIEALAKTQLSLEKIALSLGVSDSTLNRWLKRADVRAAYESGKAKGISVVTNKIYELAQNGNLGACCFIMKTRGGWRENQQIDLVSSDGSMSPKESKSAVFDFSKCSPDELKELCRTIFQNNG